MIHFSFDKEQDMLVTKASGEVSIDEMAEHYKYLRDNYTLPRKIKVLIDGRSCRNMVGVEGVDDMVNLLNLCTDRYILIKEAFLIDKPYETIIAMLFEEAVQANNYKFKIFSTIEAATYWLNL